MNNQKGFTLIELMIVIAIIAILAAIALPAYNNYVAKSQVTEAISLASSFKTPVGLHVTDNGSCPSNTSEGFKGKASPTSGNLGAYVNSMNFANADTGGGCVITATLGSSPTVNERVAGGSITLTSTGIDDETGIMKWTCDSVASNGGTVIQDKFLPKSCKGEADLEG